MHFKSLTHLLDTLKDEKTCSAYFEQLRWNGKPICPHCGYDRVYKTNRGFKCADKACYKKFTVKVGSVFEDSNISLRNWAAAIYLCTAHKKGISSYQLGRDLNVTQKTAWFMLHRIREMVKDKAPQVLYNIVEIDETYVGGSFKSMHRTKKKKLMLKGYDNKTMVVGMVQRDGNAILKVFPNHSLLNVLPYIKEHLAEGSLAITDNGGAYKFLKESGYQHNSVNHGSLEFSDFKGTHTNTIEGYFGMLKRGLYGIYHYVTPKHLQRYCDEFSYRYNSRQITDGERFNNSLTITAGRLKYKDLIKKD